jgi:hypothetical protein
MITRFDPLAKARQEEHERAEACYERVMSAEAHEAVSLPYSFETVPMNYRAPTPRLSDEQKEEQRRKSLAIKKANGDLFRSICKDLGIELLSDEEIQ